ncbi:MAG: CopG family transcriptional regulator [Spirochaetales bacterium]|nr:MAG: CopG family transcriptional regulator [Spirochaetales bacterium]
MPERKRKEDIITFKVDGKLSAAMSGIENRSAFIRDAILAALGNTCPVCRGTGILTASQQGHWDDFAAHHHLTQCADCNEDYLVCDHEVAAP